MMSYLPKKLVGYQVIRWNIRLFACIADVFFWFQQGSSDAWKKVSLYTMKRNGKESSCTDATHINNPGKSFFHYKCFLWKSFHFCCVFLLKSPCPNLQFYRKKNNQSWASLTLLILSLLFLHSYLRLYYNKAVFFFVIATFTTMFPPLSAAYIIAIAQCFDE